MRIYSEVLEVRFLMAVHSGLLAPRMYEKTRRPMQERTNPKPLKLVLTKPLHNVCAVSFLT